MTGEGWLMWGCKEAWEAVRSWRWQASTCLPGRGSQLMETCVLMLPEEPGARSHGTVCGSEPLEPCMLV